MRQPVGGCRYCGQEFMRRQSLASHEAERCPERPREGRVMKADDERLNPDAERHMRNIALEKPQEAQMSSRALTGMGAGVKVWRPGHG